MQTNENYQFELSMSLENFKDKTISNAMIGGSDKEEIRNIRKEYGFDPSSGVSFKKTTVTPQSLLSSILQGKVFCNLFNPKETKRNGAFGSHQKNNKNFSGSYLICVDIDHTGYDLDEFISKLSYKPTLYHTTPSNMKYSPEGEFLGPRFRLLYVFDEKIEHPLYFRYCVNKLYDRIENDTNEPISDRCGQNCSQYFNGICMNNPDVNLNYGITNTIYNLHDIKVSQSEYQEYLINSAGYECPSDYNETLIEDELKRLTGQKYYYHWQTNSFDTNPPVTSYEEISLCELKDSKFSKFTDSLLADWNRLASEEFICLPEWKMAYHQTKYVYRLEKEWIDHSYQFVDEDYFSLFYITHTVKDTQKRRKKLFQRMCLRRLLKPDMTKDEMVVNTIRDIINFFDNSDGILGADFIKYNVRMAFNLSIERIRQIYKKTILSLKRLTRPKRGIIYFNKQSRSKQTTFKILDDMYDNTLSVKQNLVYLNECMGYTISKTAVYDYLKVRDKKTDKHKLSDEELLLILDENLSVNKNLLFLKDNGIKCNNNRVNRLLKKKKEMIS